MVAIHDYHNDSDGTSGSESVDDTAPNNNSPNASTSSWRGWKERGKQAYIRGDYASALQNYSQALQRQQNNYSANINDFANSNTNNNNNSVREFSFPSRLDQQILLSNTVACRLKLGGAPQAEAAVVTAEKCIALNHKWAKGHYRLAEAYLSLARSYEGKTESTQDHSSNTNNASQKHLECSNKACDALQMVIQLDPGNQSARNLLTKELRYWAVGSESSNNNGGDNGAPEPSAPPEHMDENQSNSENNNSNTSNNSNQGQSMRSNNNTNNNNNNDNDNDSSNTGDGIDIEDDDHYDYTPSWQDRLSFTVHRIRAWYLDLREDDKMLVKLAVLFVVLYVAFGGRFGLEYYGTNNRGSPPRRSNDVYEDFYKSRNQNHNYQSRDNYNHRGHRSSSSSSSSSDWGGFYPYMMVLGAVACISQRFFGISPYQAIFLVTTLMGRRGGRVDPRRRYGGWGGMGGGGGGFGRNYNFRHRRGGMWGR